mmetsp:Transcript_10220/g.25572  ORF Transcript_10220/g.25572 Transcript_10220/m.25572 type:complete len:215 (+) Transcript_10220:1047-1691(+)
MLLHGRTQPVRLVAIEKSHLKPICLVQEAVHCRQDHGHGQLVRVDEVERLSHGDEDLLVDAVGHPVLPHELQDRDVVLLVDELLPLNEHREQRRRGLQLFRHREHLLIQQDRKREVEGRWDTLEEIEGGELTWELLHSENHLVAFPLKPVLNVELREEVHHVGVCPKEDVETCFDPITIFILPRRHLAAEDIACLQYDRLMTRIREVLGAREAG